MKISGHGNRMTLTINGKRCGIWLSKSPNWIKIYSKRYRFPPEFRQVLAIENGTDCQIDYFESDSVRIFPGHPLYDAAQAAS